MKTNKLTNILAGVLVAGMGVGVASCNLDFNNPNAPTATSYWSTPTEFRLNIMDQMNNLRGTYQNMFFNIGELRAGLYTLTTCDGSGILNPNVIQNQYDEAHPQFSNFAGFYDLIADCNTFIYFGNERRDEVFTTDAQKANLDYMMGMVYGLRAYYYFQLHRMYGTCPLRLEPDVSIGITEVTELYLPRAEAADVVAQIEKDINESLARFAAGTAPSGVNNVFHWTAAATNMLAGEFYLWTGKVSTGNWAADGSRVTTAKAYLNAAIAGKQLNKNFYYNWNTMSEATPETILAGYIGDEDSNAQSYPEYWLMYSNSTGTGQGSYWWTLPNGAPNTDWYTKDEMPVALDAAFNGTATRLLRTATGTNCAYFNNTGYGPMRYMYKNALYFQFDAQDTRRFSFQPVYYVKSDDVDLKSLDGFVPEANFIGGMYFSKLGRRLPTTNANGVFGYYCNAVFYRVARAYLWLAEIANYEGNNTDVVKYINLVRERAYGDNWDENLYGYTAGSFAENEIALLQEATKEFLLEGQRWWDLRRLTMVKGGTATDHLLFQPGGCVGYGLDQEIASNAYCREIGSGINDAPNALPETNTPVLSTSQAHMVLWPLAASDLSRDPLLTQTPGY